MKPSKVTLTVDQLLDEYLDGIEADGRLSPKTCFDYRHYADDDVRPHLGHKRVRDVTPEVVEAWQRQLTKGGGIQSGKGLKANTVRLARAPLSGAFKLATTKGIVAVSPLLGTPRPQARRAIPKHWSPEQARQFLALMEGDRTWTLWAFLMGLGPADRRGSRCGGPTSTCGNMSSGWSTSSLPSTTRSWPLRARAATPCARSTWTSTSKMSCGATRSSRPKNGLASADFEASDFVFTKPDGGPYHPQWVSRLLATYTKELGLPRLTAHGLRHTSATLMLASGVPPKVAAERLGHADASLFMNVYSHVTQTMQREAATKIGAALFAPETSPA